MRPLWRWSLTTLSNGQCRPNRFTSVVHPPLVEIELADLETIHAQGKLVRHTDSFFRVRDILLGRLILQFARQAFAG